MNNWPSFKSGYPDPSQTIDFPAQQSGKPSEEFVDCLPTTGVANRGTWYKLSQFTQPAQRALLADARQFYLEAKRVTSASAIPGQRLNFITQDYSGFGGQATFDFCRHGAYPRVENNSQTTGYFRATGGKIAYNILFADNHVESPPDREAGYRACRMRFPG
jgi:prepilin-type processing-associated H-X9-DG protein